jgi:rhomboid protease GluP
MQEKLKYIVWPFILIMFGLIAGYTFLRWVLLIKFHLFVVQDDVVEYWVPMVLAAAASWILIRRKLKLLSLKSKTDNWIDFYCFMAMALMAIPTIIAQYYLVSATGKLTRLGSITDISRAPETRYYALDEYYAWKRASGAHTEFNVSGRYNTDFEMHIYVAVALFHKAEDTLSAEPAGWLGVDFARTISNRFSREEKEKKYKVFADSCQARFDRKDLSHFTYFERLDKGGDLELYQKAAGQVDKDMANCAILIGMEEPFDARNGHKLAWMIFFLIVGPLIWLLMLWRPHLDIRELARIKAGKPDSSV